MEFDFINDEGNAAARALGIAQAHGLPMGMQMMGYDSETVLPTVIITGKDGKVIWMHETDNYRIRPEPDVYLEALRRHGVAKEVGQHLFVARHFAHVGVGHKQHARPTGLTHVQELDYESN